MSGKKICKGEIYKISGKKYCIGEKRIKFKKGTKITLKKFKKNKSKKIRNTRKKRKGGNGDTKCCMCGKTVDINDKANALIPSGCLMQHGQRAHRICKECWFRPVTGFAVEGVSHKCPGCEKGMPLTNIPYKEPEVVDLTLDDD
jgi:hypothetical protein